MTDIIGSIFSSLDYVFNPIIALDPNPKNPLLTIFVIAFLLSILTNLAQKYLMDHEKLDSMKKKSSEFQKKMNAVRKSGDAKAMSKLQAEQQEFMKAQSEIMMMSFRPMLVTIIPFALIFWWMRSSMLGHVYVSLPMFPYWTVLTPLWHSIGIYGGAPDLNVVFSFVGYYLPNAVGWLGWYILCSFALSQVVRKLVGLKSAF
ncbi:MAG: EMC3/TMCO1 family protein [Methanobrevibacter sp.]|jgi:uncharacterized membrane protein (DUF106 family)|nr:EMC3/TMCO1 family protein [Candidatus Methanovirga basalitermitum]